MRGKFQGSLSVLGVMFIIGAISIGIYGSTAEGTFLSNTAFVTLVALICISPFALLQTFMNGLATLIEFLSGGDKQKQNSDTYPFEDVERKQKLKNEHEPFPFDDEFEIDEIMAQLSPEQQKFLQKKLRNNSLGIGDDGELVSINELLSDYDEKEKHK